MTKFSDLFNEGYQDRINSVADAVSSAVRGQGHARDVDDLIDLHSRNQIEHKLGGRARKDFHRDVKTAIKPTLSSVNRSQGARASAKKRAENLSSFHQRLSQVINDGIGHAYPDGDPIDYIHPRAMRLASQHGIHLNGWDVGEHLDRAARHNGYRSFNHQLESTWDEIGPVGDTTKSPSPMTRASPRSG